MVKSHIIVLSVERPLLTRVISRNTREFTLGKSHVIALSVERLLVKWLISRHTRGSTLEKSHISVQHVGRVSKVAMKLGVTR